MTIEQIRRIFHPLKKIPGVTFLFNGLYKKLIAEPVRNKEIKLFQKNALRVLKEFDIVLKSCNIPYCLMWGSLIGAVREKGFIKHDFDIDVAIWKKDYTSQLKLSLEKAGFRHKQRFLIDKGESGMEDTFEKEGVAIDVFYYYLDNQSDTPYCTLFNYMEDCVTWEECIERFGTTKIYRLPMNLPDTFVYVPFEAIQMPIPKNFDEILRQYYGPNYMIPDPNWRGGNLDKYYWPDKKVEYQKF